MEGLYGSINRSGMQKIVDCMRASCGLDGSSHLVDIGAGLGRSVGAAAGLPLARSCSQGWHCSAQNGRLVASSWREGMAAASTASFIHFTHTLP